MLHFQKPGLLTTSSGAPVAKCQATSTLNTNLLQNSYAMEALAHLSRERIPERAVHAKGTGAFGHFTVTNDMSHICKASFLKKGAKTRVAVRFSTSAGNLGTSDMNLDSKGFAVKFYTKEGNFDVVGFSTPMFLSKEPLHGHTIVHTTSGRRHPSSHLWDATMVWDFITLVPEALYINMYLFAGRGHPASFRHIAGFSIHTYQFENEKGDISFARMHFEPDQGIKTITADEAEKIGAKNPDHFVQDLYESIANGSYPSWTMYLQIIPKADALKSPDKFFDITRTVCKEKYPLHKVGHLVLDRNPKNWHAEMEQIAMCPCHVIPGIPGAPDKAFELRSFVYRDTQMHRLGANYNRIPVNCPLRAFTYNRDGAPPLGDNEGDAPNYYPNSFNGPEPYESKRCPKLVQIKESKAYNLDQATELYNEFTDEQRDVMIKNMASQLKTVHKYMQDKALNLFKQVHEDFAYRMAMALNRTETDCEDK